MAYIKKDPAINLLLLLFITILFSCQESLYKATGKNEPEVLFLHVKSSRVMNSIDTATSTCDPAIWKHVYNPARLKVINNCITVSGVIKESHAESDGDQHLLLKPDVSQQILLKKKNIQKKDGCLVIEAVCINNITEAKVGNACKGYVNHVQIPKVGDHVKVTGSYVLDSHNGWAEIHPISKIVVQ